MLGQLLYRIRLLSGINGKTALAVRLDELNIQKFSIKMGQLLGPLTKKVNSTLPELSIAKILQYIQEHLQLAPWWLSGRSHHLD